MMQSKRNRNKGRTLKTYNNKLTKITLRFNKLFYQSKNNREAYLVVPEQDRKNKDRTFFCDKYPSLSKFLEVNRLRQVSNK